MAKTITYRRRGGEGTLSLHGVVDIFEAASLRDAALRAVGDAGISTLHLDVAHAERLDVSALQILFALRNEIEGQERTFIPGVIPPAVADSLAKIGCVL